MPSFIPSFLFSVSAPSSVVGGSPAAPGAWPDAVAVLSAEAACTGTLITPDVVLTAGHCIDTQPAVVVVDTVDYGKPGGEPIQVRASLAYPGWEGAYDVGVVLLEHPASARPRLVAATCTVSEALVVGTAVHLVGFGLTTAAGTGSNSRLREGEVAIIDPACDGDPACNPAVAPGGEFTAGGRGVDSCFGDSGGPVYLDTPQGPALVGVVSRALGQAGPPCGGGGVYVRADQVLSWVERMTGETVRRTRCRAPVDDGAPSDAQGSPLQGEGSGASAGGCSASAGPTGTAMLAVLGALAVGRAPRRRRAQRP
jgi:uncharacterized protein (TIGR03382 family)